MDFFYICIFVIDIIFIFVFRIFNNRIYIYMNDY